MARLVPIEDEEKKRPRLVPISPEPRAVPILTPLEGPPRAPAPRLQPIQQPTAGVPQLPQQEPTQLERVAKSAGRLIDRATLAPPTAPQQQPQGLVDRTGRAIRDILPTAFQPAEGQSFGQRALRTAAAPFTAPARGVREFTESRGGRGVLSGAIGTAASIAGAVPAIETFVGADTVIGRGSENLAKQLRKLSETLAPDDPTFADKLASGGGSLIMFLIPGLGVARGVGAVAGAGVFAARLAPALGIGVTTLLEAATEQGDTFISAIDQGVPREEAADRAFNVFWKNAVLVGVTNAATFGLGRAIPSAVKRAIIGAPSEGVQEGVQEIIQSQEAGRPIDWDNVLTAFGVGAILGGGVAAVDVFSQAQQADQITPQGPPGVAPTTPTAIQPREGTVPAPTQLPSPAPITQPQVQQQEPTGIQAGLRQQVTIEENIRTEESIQKQTKEKLETAGFLSNDLGMKSLLETFNDTMEKALNLPYDNDTKHDIKNLVAYMFLRKPQVGLEKLPIFALEKKQKTGNAEGDAQVSPAGFEFVSPNIEEGTNLDFALKQLKSQDHARAKSISSDIDKTLGLDSVVHDAIGDWTDGSENSLFTEISGNVDFDTLRYSAVVKGKSSNQKGVIPFRIESGGADRIYRINVPTDDIVSIQNKLNEFGVRFRTFVKSKKGETQIIVYDQGAQLAENIKKVGAFYGRQIEEFEGQGEFIGGDSRVEGLREYNRVIEEFTGRPREQDPRVRGERVSDIERAPAEGQEPRLRSRVIPESEQTIRERELEPTLKSRVISDIGGGGGGGEGPTPTPSGFPPGQPGTRIPLPSERPPVKKVTERQALRASLQRQVFAAGQAATATTQQLQEIKKDLTNSVKQAFRPADRGRFLNMVAAAKTSQDVVKANQRIAEGVEKLQRRDLTREIKNQFKRVKASKSISVDYIRRVESLVQDITFTKTTKGKLERLQSTQDFIDRQRAAGQDMSVPQYVLNELTILGRKPAIDLTASELQGISDSIQQLADLGKTKLRAREALDESFKENAIKELVAGTVPIQTTQKAEALPGGLGPELGIAAKLNNEIKGMLDFFQNSRIAVKPMDAVFDKQDGFQDGQGPNSRIFKRSVDVRFGNYMTESSQIEKEFWDLAEKLNINEAQMERIGIFGAKVQEGGRDKLHNSGLTDEQIDSIVLTPKENQLYLFGRRKMDEIRPRIEEIMRTVYNAPLGEVENYLSFMTDFDAMSESEVQDRMFQNAEQELGALKKNVELGFTKERVGAGKQKIKLNFGEIYTQHMDNVTYLLHVGEITKRLGEIANSQEYRQAAGDAGSQTTREWVDLVARKGRSPGHESQMKVMRMINSLRRNVGAATLGLKLSSALIQPTAVFPAMAVLGPGPVLRGAVDFSTSRQWREFLLDNFPEIKNRVGDDTAFKELSKNQTLKEIQQKGFWVLQKLDGVTASAVAAGAYRSVVEAKGQQVDLNNPDQQAIQEAQRLVRISQGSSSFKDQPLAISRGKFTGSVAIDKSLFQFQSFLMTEFDVIAHAIEKTTAKPSLANFGEVMNRAFFLTLMHLAAMGIRDVSKKAIGSLGGEPRKDEEFKREFALEVLGSIPFVSQFVSIGVYGGDLSPSLQSFSKLARGATGIFTRPTGQGKAAAARDIVAGGGRLIGIPGTAQLEEFLRNLSRRRRAKAGVKGALGRSQSSGLGSALR